MVHLDVFLVKNGVLGDVDKTVWRSHDHRKVIAEFSKNNTKNGYNRKWEHEQ